MKYLNGKQNKLFIFYSSLLSRTNSLPNLYSCGSDSNQSDCSTNGSNVSSHHTNSPVNYECDSAKLNTHEGEDGIFLRKKN